MADRDTKHEHAPASPINPRTTSFEFAGPIGAFFVLLTVPATIYALAFSCSEPTLCRPHLASIPLQLRDALTDPLDLWKKYLWDFDAVLLYVAWYIFCVVTWAILPGDRVEGTTLRNGKRKVYKCNAFSTFLLTLGLVSGTIYRFGPGPFSILYDKWLGLVTASLLMSLFQAMYSYATSFRKNSLLALGGNSGNHIYDFFIGRELNPSIGPLDLKFFNELRPGLILWILIDIGMLSEQAIRRGGLHNVTDSMWLVLAFHFWYVVDALYNEPALLTTMDITTDGFGFMLSVGDLTWVPFTYSIQARYLAFRHVQLGPVWTTAVILLNLTGYYIFRDSNSEKNDFRNGRNPKNLQYMTTESGSKLLTSGWWGYSRHPNYFGDLIMGLAWCLPTGFDAPLTYFYSVYFAALLAHRQTRDDHACEKKYGKDWEKYKTKVPYRIVPYVY